MVPRMYLYYHHHPPTQPPTNEQAERDGPLRFEGAGEDCGEKCEATHAAALLFHCQGYSSLFPAAAGACFSLCVSELFGSCTPCASANANRMLCLFDCPMGTSGHGVFVLEAFHQVTRIG